MLAAVTSFVTGIVVAVSDDISSGDITISGTIEDDGY